MGKHKHLGSQVKKRISLLIIFIKS